MAQKKITDLQLRDNVTGTLNFPSDDTIQSYRVTAEQIKDYVLGAGNVGLSALAAAVAQALNPAGSVIAFAGSTAPSGYLHCDGSAVSRTTYADLFAAIGTAHGSGDGSTTFNLPDYRGRFLRGWSNGQTLDPDKASRTAMNTGGATGDNVGSVQGHAFQTHTHTQATHTHSINGERSSLANNTAGLMVSGQSNGGFASTWANASMTSVAPTINTTGATGATAQASTNETRPLNAYVMYCIKV